LSELPTTEDAVISDGVDQAQAVTVAYVNGNTVTYSWHHSMIELIGYDMATGCRIMAGGYIAIRYGTDGLTDARNKGVREFLADRQADWMLWVDCDMGFPADSVERLIAAADPVERPIVGGLCFTQQEREQDSIGGWRCRAVPTLFDWKKVDIVDRKVVNGERVEEKVGEQQGFAVRWDYPSNSMVKVAGTGSAFILIHRSVFKRIEKEFGPVWYDRTPNTTTGQLISEDLSFCIRAGALDIPVYVHTGLRTSHCKTVWLSEEDYWRQRAVDPPPPALPKTAEADRD
jgi:hypothetical protein